MSNRTAALVLSLFAFSALAGASRLSAEANGLTRTWHGDNGNPHYFDGTSTIRWPDSPEFNLPNGSAWTLEAWVFPTARQDMHIAGKRGVCASGDGFYQIAIGHNAPNKGMGIEPADAPINTWTLVTLVADGSTGWTVYANGVLVKTVIQPGWRVENSATFRIGGSGTCAPFVGMIDEVSLYSRALSGHEIQAHYAAKLASVAAPLSIAECENANCAAGKINGNVATWTLHGKLGIALWPMTGAVSTLEVERFDGSEVIIRRTNTPNSQEARGLTAIYRGRITGNQIDGTVTWTWNGFKTGVAHGNWHASMGSAKEQQDQFTNQRTLLASMDRRSSAANQEALILLIALGSTILGSGGDGNDTERVCTHYHLLDHTWQSGMCDSWSR